MYEFAVTPAVTQIRRRGVEIAEVAAGSLGAELELEPGDRIMSVNGRTVRDYLDFRFQTAGETEMVVDVRKPSGEHWELNIERADISGKLRQLLDAGIEIHAQVVLCPTINDGEVLRKTIADLADLHPKVSSVAIVPLGLTRYLDDPRLTPVTPEFCRRTIREVTKIQGDLRERLGTTFA